MEWKPLAKMEIETRAKARRRKGQFLPFGILGIS
jgi:hypothetical protein